MSEPTFIKPYYVLNVYKKCLENRPQKQYTRKLIEGHQQKHNTSGTYNLHFLRRV